jgi:hypothetical protein
LLRLHRGCASEHLRHVAEARPGSIDVLIVDLEHGEERDGAEAVRANRHGISAAKTPSREGLSGRGGGGGRALGGGGGGALEGALGGTHARQSAEMCSHIHDPAEKAAATNHRARGTGAAGGRARTAELGAGR